MKRSDIVLAGGDRLLATEDAVDKALTETGDRIATLTRLRVSGNVSAIYGLDAIDARLADGNRPGAFTSAIFPKLDDPLAVQVFEFAPAESILEQFEAISLRSPQGLADVLHMFDVKVDQSSEGFDPGHVFSCRSLAGIALALDTSRHASASLFRLKVSLST